MPRLDWMYEPTSQLDIVVSMYKEPTWEVRSIVSALEEIPTVYNRHPRVIIYTKDPDADVLALQRETGAANVTKLPNVGRESHTFLHHILSNWNDLAAQTLFIQAEVHMVDAFLARIRDYYLPSTGMMALGYSGRTCDCNDCGDRDWHDTNPNNTIASVYQRVHNQTCDRALMSYRGQFIASARRIRAVDPAIYEELSRDLSEPESWSFKDEFRYDVDRVNTVDAPQFGYTVERLWNILFQCSDPYVAWLCPSFENGISRWGSRRDCQCFDY
ncbi:hypothetical protein K490DRAFT_76185 [Saccharata proteae CBS 121410]|uniref:Uncharacterized protein n=1 Tax=Saccharata proteae CBS 121410 TaxID=1314787 RepID=A0A9P4LWF0_9PEZI|nr:hypothetical protein K490DRAFT_76185 [Saccharata proteae CBS 121410]